MLHSAPATALLINSSLGDTAEVPNWAEYLEYGTTDYRVIELQNYGIPRHLALYLIENHDSSMNFDDSNNAPFEKKKVLELMNKESDEFRELSELELYY